MFHSEPRDYEFRVSLDVLSVFLLVLDVSGSDVRWVKLNFSDACVVFKTVNPLFVLMIL